MNTVQYPPPNAATDEFWNRADQEADVWVFKGAWRWLDRERPPRWQAEPQNAWHRDRVLWVRMFLDPEHGLLAADAATMWVGRPHYWAGVWVWDEDRGHEVLLAYVDNAPPLYGA